MGIKFLSLQMIPWCFHVMGSHHHITTTAISSIASPPHDSTTTTKKKNKMTKKNTTTTNDNDNNNSGEKCMIRLIKLVGTDGRVAVYDRPVSASELMEAHPKHLVCRSDAFYIGQRVPALTASEELQPGHSYFLLPTHFFQSVLSFVTVASSLARAANNNKAALSRPFDVHKTSAGTLQIRVSDEFIERMKEAQEGAAGNRGDENRGGGNRVCTTAELEKDYKQLVGCNRGRQWKPKLETIRESKEKGGGGRRRLLVVVGGGGAFGGFRTKRKKSPKPKPEPLHHHHQNSQQQESQQKQKQQQQQPKQQKKKAIAAAGYLISPPKKKSKGKKKGGL